MNSLYHIAIIEGYLAQHPELPKNVVEAIAYFKKESIQQKVTDAPKRKKRKLSPEQKEKMLAHLANMRQIRIQKRESRKAA